MAAPKNPKGAKSDKEWRGALRLALHEEYDDDKSPGGKAKALRLVARSVVEAAIGGDMAAAREIGDRLDGKANQPVEVDVADPVRELLEKIDGVSRGLPTDEGADDAAETRH